MGLNQRILEAFFERIPLWNWIFLALRTNLKEILKYFYLFEKDLQSVEESKSFESANTTFRSKFVRWLPSRWKEGEKFVEPTMLHDDEHSCLIVVSGYFLSFTSLQLLLHRIPDWLHFNLKIFHNHLMSHTLERWRKVFPRWKKEEKLLNRRRLRCLLLHLFASAESS